MSTGSFGLSDGVFSGLLLCTSTIANDAAFLALETSTPGTWLACEGLEGNLSHGEGPAATMVNSRRTRHGPAAIDGAGNDAGQVDVTVNAEEGQEWFERIRTANDNRTSIVVALCKTFDELDPGDVTSTSDAKPPTAANARYVIGMYKIFNFNVQNNPGSVSSGSFSLIRDPIYPLPRKIKVPD